MSDFLPLLIAVSVAVGSIFFANKKHEEEVEVISKTIFVLHALVDRSSLLRFSMGGEDLQDTGQLMGKELSTYQIRA